MGVYLIAVYLMGVYLTGVHVMGMYFINVHFMGVYLTGVHLMGVHLMDVCFMDVYMWCRKIFGFPNPKRFLGKCPSQGKLSARSSHVKLIPTYNFYLLILSFRIFQLRCD